MTTVFVDKTMREVKRGDRVRFKHSHSEAWYTVIDAWDDPPTVLLDPGMDGAPPAFHPRELTMRPKKFKCDLCGHRREGIYLSSWKPKTTSMICVSCMKEVDQDHANGTV